MKRLLILDPSLKGPGGHHFDYVGQLLRAARDRVQVVVACHRRFDRPALVRMAESSDRVLEQLDFRPLFCQTIYHTCSDITGIRKLAVDGMRGAKRWTVPIKQCWDRWTPEGRREEQLLQQAPCQDGSERSVIDRLDREQQLVLAKSVRDLRRVFRAVAQPSLALDAVFHTTLSDLDLLALAWCMKEGSVPRDSVWSLQFHFDLFLGRPDEYAAQRDSFRMKRCLETFRLAKHWMHGFDYHWYATSDSIAQQYDWLGVGKFHELTYPINSSFVPREPDQEDRVMRMTLAGGVRSEKGQGRLEQVVASIAQPLLAPEKAKIVVQRRARKGWHRQWKLSERLAGPNSRWIEYVDHPLPESAYVDLIRRADVGLMLHDGRTYHARRAGVLGEFLAAGVPVVVPAASWLSRCVESMNRKYWEQLATQGKPLSDHSTRSIPEQDARRRITVHPGGLLIGCVSTPVTSHETRYLRCRLVDDHDEILSQVIVNWEQGRNHFALPIPLRIPENSPVILTWDWIYEDLEAVLSPPEIEFCLVSAVGGQAIPWGAVGWVAIDDNQVAEALQEVCRHRHHYQAQARRASFDWRDRHDPLVSLQTLLDPEGEPRQAVMPSPEPLASVENYCFSQSHN